MSTAVTTQSAGMVLSFTNEQKQLIKDTVAKGATDNELALFLHLAQTYGLDPFAKEIWCLKYGGQAATIFTGRDGYLKIANGRPEMDGMQSDAVYANDMLVKRSDGTVEHTYGNPERGKLIGAYAMVFRKDRARAAYFYAPMSEYNAGSNPTWKKFPTAMIIKVAEACALKRAFSISGLVTHEEMDVEAERVATAARAQQESNETYAEVLVEQKVPTLNESVKQMLAAASGDEANAVYAAAAAATRGHEDFLEAVNLTKQKLNPKPGPAAPASTAPEASDTPEESGEQTEESPIDQQQQEELLRLLNNPVILRKEKVAGIDRMKSYTWSQADAAITAVVNLIETRENGESAAA